MFAGGMPPSPIPAPLPPWAKAALYLAPVIDDVIKESAGFLWDLLTHEGQAPELSTWRHLQVRIKNMGASSTAKDDAWVTFDIANITGGSLDSTWSAGDYTTVEGLFDTYWTALKPKISTLYSVAEYRWYKRSFTALPSAPIPPGDRDKPFVDGGPPEKVTTKSIAGTGVNIMPPQVAISVTEKTAWPKHWGRFYLPGPDAMLLTTAGRLSSSSVTSILTPTSALFSGLATAEFPVVVPVTQLNKDPARLLLTVNQIQIDDVLDVIRRRRYATPLIRSVAP